MTTLVSQIEHERVSVGCDDTRERMLGLVTKLGGRGLGGALLEPVPFQTAIATEIVVSAALFLFGTHRAVLRLTEVHGHGRGGGWRGGDKLSWCGHGS